VLVQVIHPADWFRRQRAQQLVNWGLVSTIKAASSGETLPTAYSDLPLYLLRDAYVGGIPPVACRRLTPPFEIVEETVREIGSDSGHEHAHGFVKRFLRNDLRAARVSVLDRAMCLYTAYGAYGDWVFQHVPKVVLAEKTGFAGAYLVPPQQFAREILLLIGIAPERIIVHTDQLWKVANLFVMPWFYSAYLFEKHPELFITIRNAMLRSVKVGKAGRRAYISRNRPDLSRHILNEPEFKQLIAKFDFHEYFPQDHSIAAQISYFSECTAVIGATGSGMHNSIFMPERSLIMELFSPLRHEYRYSLFIAKQLKQRYYSIFPYYSSDVGYQHGNDVIANLDLIGKTLEQEFL